MAYEEGAPDYAAPRLGMAPPRSRAVMVSDFLGDIGRVKDAMTRASDRGVDGVLLQVLDPRGRGLSLRWPHDL